MASEEKSFEYVDDGQTDGWTTDACLYYKLTNEPSAQMSSKSKCVWNFDVPFPFLTLKTQKSSNDLECLVTSSIVCSLS